MFAIALVITILAGINHSITERKYLNMNFSGEIIESYHKGHKEKLHTDDMHYKFYWEVATDEGDIVTIRVLKELFSRGRKGTKVEKIAGEQYPKIIY